MTKSRGILAPKRPWEPHEVLVIQDLYADVPTGDIAALLERTSSCVYQRAYQMGLKKSDAFLQSPHCRRLNGVIGTNTRFHKGLVPWNSGTKGVSDTHPNSRATQFKKGDRLGAAQHNYVPIGTLRVCADGYLERKVTDDPELLPVRRWVAVHRLVWEAANGPIPAGHVVTFKPGMKTAKLEEITTERLECISRGLLATRNHPRGKSPELAKLVQLKGAITRQVKRIHREAQERQATP